MARTWLQIRVELVSGLGGEFKPRPGRVFAVPPSLTFDRLADAVNRAFGRWDFSHLHAFEFADGRRIGFTDVDTAISKLPSGRRRISREWKACLCAAFAMRRPASS